MWFLKVRVNMKKITMSKFKAQCLEMIERVHNTRESILITKGGRPVAKLVPAGRAPSFLGRLRGVVEINGDIESPMVAAGIWNVLQ